jgi:hypothetical protein
LFCLLALSACAIQRDPIDRVQANALRKETLAGDWFYLQTVIDTPYSAGFTFVGEQGKMRRVRWEIDEHHLIARSAVAHIAHGEPEGLSGEGTEQGAPLAMFAIQSHFDIRREYNPTTGEELNVISENTVDRPWYEREFMRVDWSQNLITDNEFLLAAKLFYNVSFEPVAYFSQGEDDPNRPRFEVDEDSDRVYYIDIVNKLVASPEEVEIPGFGMIPSCYLYESSFLDCAPSTITVRSSFLQVDESRDYQPQIYTGDRMERFGYFVTERAGYTADYGLVEPARYRFVNRHNLWMASHRRTETGDLMGCTTDNHCGQVFGSLCDLDWAKAYRNIDPSSGKYVGVCTIPYRDREVRPVVYHLSANTPDDLIVDAQHLVSEWNRAFVETVASLRENECLAEGGAPDRCASERDRSDHQKMFVLCQNPVTEVDHVACGPVGTVARIGDLRYSLIGWVNDPHRYSPLGYGPSAADPLTGELIMGNAFVYGAAMDTLATYARDIVGLLLGDIDPASITTGAHVEGWAERMMAQASLETGRPADDHVIGIDGFNVDQVEEAMDFSWARAGMPHAHQPPATPRELLDRAEAARKRLVQTGAFGGGHEWGQSRLDGLIGTDIERLMTGPDLRVMAGLDPSWQVSDGILDRASPLRGMNPSRWRDRERLEAAMQRRACVLHADFADPGLIGLARAIARAVREGDSTMTWYGRTYQLGEDGTIDYELVREMLRHPIFDAVTAHEVGHTVGLRHNFSASYDALNYHPRYWELRDDGDMRPRAWDPMTEEEIDGRIQEYQYSSVMDYGANFVVTDAEGIGHYDMAAIKMGYGDLVEVFAELPPSGATEVSWIGMMLRLGWPVALDMFANTYSLRAYNYTDWPQVLGGRRQIQQRVDVPYTSLQPEPMLAQQGINDPLVDPQGRPAVPYLFCSDEQADLNPDCMRYDAGADAYEAVQSVINNYWNYYIFNNFRRERLGYNVQSTANRIHGRYLEKLQRANQIYSLYRGLFEDIFGVAAQNSNFYTDEHGMGAWTAAVGSAFQLLSRVVTSPEPGDYSAETRADGTRAMVSSLTGGAMGGAGVDIDITDARYLETTWNMDAGYFWFDQLERVGFFYDKIIALMTLTDPTTYFVGRDTDSDIRRYQISFASSFGPSLTGLMRGILSDDWSAIAPRESNGRLWFPDALSLVKGEVNGVPVDPNTSFSIQLYAAVYGLALIPETYDQAFLNQSRLFVRGGAEGVEFAEGQPTVEFTDPSSGLTYVAASYPDGNGQEMGVAALMLRHAAALQARADNASSTAQRDHAAAMLDQYIDNLDVLRELTWHFGFGSQP